MIKFETTEYAAGFTGKSTRVTHTVGVGSTLFVKRELEQVMSDVWDYVTHAYYIDDSGRMLSTYFSEAEVDVSEAAFQRYRKYIYEGTLERAVENSQREAAQVTVRGRTVKVVRGRKCVGIQGKVVAVIDSMYNAGYRQLSSKKLGIALDDTKVQVVKNGRTYENYANVQWVWAHNCEVVNPDQPDMAQLEQFANDSADLKLQQLRNQVRDYWAAGGKKTVAMAA